MKTIIYARTSTDEQNVNQQAKHLEKLYPHFDYSVTEQFTGTTLDRPKFQKMLKSLESGDSLVVLKIDRIGRDAIEVQTVVSELTDKGVKVIVSDLDGIDLSSMAGKIVLAVLAQVAEGERKTMLERQRIGIERAKTEGKYKGRKSTDPKIVHRIKELHAQKMKVTEIAGALDVGVSTVYKILKEAS
ncbi:recombinase family protein [Shewanella sp. KX20019]|uniref:recombinase family protein n=1 Tax=Shewanella sp. KX20019 TaxID=2803864 RepID=UPI001925E4F9|nr:recombinase family protein [Shewanella sp. KX20019]QQX82202.1 recombinase family protein [Shewanella sp. KX20019]